MAYSDKEKEKIINKVCERISKGDSLREVLKDESLPCMDSFYKWIDKDDGKAKQYARACELRAESIFEDMLTIADDGTNDYMTVVKGDKEYNVEDREVTNRSKLRIDARKWMLSKMMPKKYGDKLEIESTIDDKRKTIDQLFPTDQELTDE